MMDTRIGNPVLLGLDETPDAVAGRLRHLPGFVYLDSASERAGAISLITALPDRMLRGDIGEPADREMLREALVEMETGAAENGGGCDWGIPLGGLFGAVDFDGSFIFGRYGHALVFHHDSDKWNEVGSVLGAILERQDKGEGGGSGGVGGRNRGDRESAGRGGVDFSPEMGKSEFCGMVRAAQDYIAAGDIYQVNLSHRFSADWALGGDGFGFYERLRERSPAPMGAFFDLCGRQVLSASPESFLKMSGRWVRTKPIKGTRPRFRDPGRDALSALELQRSEKEAAELVMITDLERNDLGQVCEFGSVAVPEMLRLEAFEQVYHLVSTVEGTLREDVDHVDALARCFPGGSIAGAPKQRALEVIAELERTRRGLYTGAIGYFGANGESHFNIAIRTAVIEGGQIHFHVGAGIVADSDPEKEWEETLHKAAGILAAAEN